MKILLFGATGMLGQGVLRECLLAPDVELVEAIGRSAAGAGDAKFREIVHADLFEYTSLEEQLKGFHACFFCLGVSSAGMTEAAYERITYGITLAAAETLARLNPQMVFIYISGAGTDSSEQGKVMWARIKGKTENALLLLPFRAVYLFRPGIIRPRYGARSKTPLYRWFYILTSPLLALLQRVFPNFVLDTSQIGLAMLAAVRRGAPRPVLESADIHALAGS